MELENLKGTRDYLPAQQIVRERIIEVLKEKFKLYGFKPVETSILDFYKIAASKYAGSEIVNEIYKLRDRGKRQLALRYELTFKLAKLIGLNPNLRMPFKRYEIGKVFRDGPVKRGRLREFTQCDVDVVGVKSKAADAEIIALAFDIFDALHLDVFVKINSINILFGIFDYCGIPKDNFSEVALSIDKLEKFGKEYVVREIKEKGIKKENIEKIFDIFEKLEGKSNNEKIKILEKINNGLIKKGIEEIKEFFNYLKNFEKNSSFNISEDVLFLPSLARGLSYYTGLIWEFYLKEGEIKSSVAAGGRWDNLISKFLETKKEYPAVGMSFGLDVIFEALKRKIKLSIPKILIIPLNTVNESIEIATKIRKASISCDIAYEKSLSKALDYANKENIEYCLIIGKKELSQGKVKLKEMESGKEKILDIGKVIEILKKQ